MFQRMMLIGVLVLLPGCSWAFVDGPPPNLPDTYNPLVSPCTTSKAVSYAGPGWHCSVRTCLWKRFWA